MPDRPIAPTVEGRHLSGDHRGTRVQGCPLCYPLSTSPTVSLQSAFEALSHDRAYQRLSDGELATLADIATDILSLIEAEEQRRVSEARR